MIPRRPISFDELTPEQRTAACTRNIGNVDDLPPRVREAVKNAPYGAGDMVRVWSVFQRGGEDAAIRLIEMYTAECRQMMSSRPGWVPPSGGKASQPGDGTYASVKRKWT